MLRVQTEQSKVLLKYWRRNKGIINKTIMRMMAEYPHLGHWEAINPDFQVIVVASPDMMRRKELVDPNAKFESVA